MGNHTARSKSTEEGGDVIVLRRNSGKVLLVDESKTQHLPGFIPSATNSRKSTPYLPEREKLFRGPFPPSPLRTIFGPPLRHFLPPVDDIFPTYQETEKNNDKFPTTKKVAQQSPPHSPGLQEHIREIRNIVNMDSDSVDDFRPPRGREKASGKMSKSAVERRSTDDDAIPSVPQRAAISERALSITTQEELERPRATQLPPANRRRSSLRSGLHANRLQNNGNNNNRDRNQNRKDDGEWNYHTPKIDGFDIDKFKEVNGHQQAVTKGYHNDTESRLDNSQIDDIPFNTKPMINGFMRPRKTITSVNPLTYDITEEELIASIEKEFDM